MSARHFHIAPIFPYIQGHTPCSQPGCHRTAVYMTAWPDPEHGKPGAQYWRAFFVCREHFEEAKKEAQASREVYRHGE